MSGSMREIDYVSRHSPTPAFVRAQVVIEKKLVICTATA
jgi:hypothetical protein